MRHFFRAAALLLLALPGLAGAADMMPGKGRPELGSSAAFAPDGSLLVAAKQGEHVMLYRSRDDGQHWLPPVTVNAKPEAISADGENRPKVAVASDGGILVTWTRPLGKPYSGAIRLARADDGERFSAPITVHRDPAEITHRFESLLTLPDNRVVVVWIDKRDLEIAKAAKSPYRGAALYTASSADGGRSFQAERKLADHSCECCRIAGALDRDGSPLFLWRHVFAPNERDHALAGLNADGSARPLQRATFDRWKVEGCPHHGPSLAVDADGVRHAVWFNQKEGQGRVFYGRLSAQGEGPVEGQRPIGGPRAAHADLVAADGRVLIVWKEFDGERTRLRALLSTDGGQGFAARELAATEGASDQPRALRRGAQTFAFWRTEREGFLTIAVP